MKKRKRDDENQRKRLDVRAKQRMDRGRKRKMEEKEKTGKKILMPEVFISNYMKQQRNFVKYKREVSGSPYLTKDYQIERKAVQVSP